MSSLLRADVYVSSRLPIAIKRAGDTSSFSPISCTLIQGNTEAVLVDTPISVLQTEDLVQWIKDTAPGKDLKYIYITHGHGDHWFGITVIQKYWPNVRPIAVPNTVAHMKEQTEPARFEGVWLKYFPGNKIPQPLVLAEPMDSNTFQIEGHDFHAVGVGHSDTTILHVPSMRLVVAGDVVYGDVHQFFGEANTTEKREEWLRAIDTIEALKPHTVIAGHKRAGTVDGLFNLRSTREYILAFEEAAKTTSNWEELWEKMKSLYPGRINPHAIIAGAVAAFKNQLSKWGIRQIKGLAPPLMQSSFCTEIIKTIFYGSSYTKTHAGATYLRTSTQPIDPIGKTPLFPPIARCKLCILLAPSAISALQSDYIQQACRTRYIGQYQTTKN